MLNADEKVAVDLAEDDAHDQLASYLPTGDELTTAPDTPRSHYTGCVSC